jgi:peptidoglycan/LPS O-acetylase OafA/YrhL
MPPAREYFPQLTGVRALAAWSVFNYHFNSFSPAVVGDWVYRFTGDWVYRFTEEMYLGVNIFYVLSGFLIYHRYEPLLVAGTRRELAVYARNRVARIYPVYWLLLLGGYVVAGFPDTLTCLATLTLTHAFFPTLVHAGIPQAWTLTIEETFYFSAPLLFWGARHVGLLGTCLAVAALGWVLPAAGIGTVDHVLGRTLCGAIGCFGCGMALARTFERRQGRPLLGTGPWLTYGGLAVAALLVLGMSRLSPLVEASLPPGNERHGRDHPLGALAMFTLFPALVAVVFYGLLTERSRLCAWLGTRTAVLLGGASYSFYLLHLGALQGWWFEHVSDNYLVAFLVCNALAIGLYLLYEKPMARWIRGAAGGGNLRSSAGAESHLGVNMTPAVVSAGSRERIWKWSAYGAVALLLILIEWLPRSLIGRGQPDRALLWLAEDGPYESLEAVLCVVAAILFFAAAYFTNGAASLGVGGNATARPGYRRWRRGWLFALAGLLLAMACAELSFGQRLFGFETPGWLRSRNYQGEFSFHNLLVFQSDNEGNRLQNVWLLGLLLYVGLLPIAARVWRKVGEIVDRIGLPLASVPLALLLLMYMVLYITLTPVGSESLELAFDVVLVALAVEMMLAVPADTRALAWRWGGGVALGVGLLMLLLLSTVSGKYELPTARSQEMVNQAMRQAGKDDLSGAKKNLEAAILLWPQNGEAHYQLARILAAEDNTPAAMKQLQRAVELRSSETQWRLALAMMLTKTGQNAEAIAQLHEILRRAPDAADVQTQLAWLLATSPEATLRNGADAVTLAEAAAKKTGDTQIFTLDVLAASYAEVGRFDEAARTAARAFEAAISAQNVGLAAEIRARQRLYEARKPYRMSPAKVAP